MGLDPYRKNDYSAIPGGKTAPPTQRGAGNVAGGGAYNNGTQPIVYPKPPKAATPASAPQAAPPAGGGSESGAGILENWFNARASGTDPAYEYAMDRGMDSIDDRMAAGGSFNSGARGRQISDFAANMGAQRLGQLDALAGGASGEHLGRLNMMFNQGLGVAGGQAGLASQYDLGAAGNMDAANRAQGQMFLDKAGVDSQFAQGRLNSLINAYSAYQSGKS